MSLIELLNLFSKTIALSSSIVKLGDDSRSKVGAYLTHNSECLLALAKKRESGKSTNFECAELGIYLDRIPSDLKRILGHEYVDDLVGQFRAVISSPGGKIFVTDNASVSSEEIKSLAGKLIGLANTI